MPGMEFVSQDPEEWRAKQNYKTKSQKVTDTYMKNLDVEEQ